VFENRVLRLGAEW